jgi:hypothetical protein
MMITERRDGHMSNQIISIEEASDLRRKPTMTKTTLTETFHVVQSAGGIIYYLIRNDVLRAYNSALKDLSEDDWTIHIGGESITTYWGMCPAHWGLDKLDLGGLTDYSSCVGSQVPSDTQISLTRKIFDLLLNPEEPTNEPEIPTTRVW